MKREEARKHLIDWIEFVNDPDKHPFIDEPCSDEEIIEAMRIGAEVLSQPSLPSNIDEAAERYGTEKHPMSPIGAKESEYDFKTGAEWMIQQGETIFATIIDGGKGWLTNNRLQGNYDDGEEVIVQIRKKQ